LPHFEKAGRPAWLSAIASQSNEFDSDPKFRDGAGQVLDRSTIIVAAHE
jgi:hypothetical protein